MKKLFVILFAFLATVGNVRAEEITIWEGSQSSSIYISSGTELYDKLFGDADGQANLTAGDKITFYYTGAADDSQVWLQANWDTLSGEGSMVTISGEGSHDFNVSATDLEEIKSKGIRFRIGAGSLTFTKIVVTKTVTDSSEIDVWEGTESTNLILSSSQNASSFAILVANLEIGDKIWFSYTNGNGQLWLQSNWAGLNIQDDNCPDVNGDGSYEFTVLAPALSQITNNGLMIRVGSGSCTITKVMILKAEGGVSFPGASEIILWSGSDTSSNLDFRYGTLNTNLIAAGITAKDTIKVYLSDVEANDYIQIKEAGGDWTTLNNSRALTADQQIYELPLTENYANRINTNYMAIQRKSDNGAITYDYELRYVTIAKYTEKVVPGYELLYSGDPYYIDWSYQTYCVPKSQICNLAANDIIHLYITPGETSGGRVTLCYLGGNNKLPNYSNTVSSSSYHTFTVDESWLDTITEYNLLISGYYYYLNKAVLEHPTRFVSVTMSADGLATFSHATEAIDLSWVDGLKAYKASVSGDRIVTERVTGTVAANTGLILQGEASATYRIPFAASGTALTGNVLAPTDGSAISGYVLGHTETGGTAFYKVSGKTVVAGKAYIPENVTTARQLSIDLLGDETTGIVNINDNEIVNSKSVNRNYYNLQGQRVSAGAKGLVIVNGKKVFNK